jgi:hypothetical protein
MNLIFRSRLILYSNDPHQRISTISIFALPDIAAYYEHYKSLWPCHKLSRFYAANMECKSQSIIQMGYLISQNCPNFVLNVTHSFSKWPVKRHSYSFVSNFSRWYFLSPVSLLVNPDSTALLLEDLPINFGVQALC